jgi:hypothetical protein
VVQKTCDRLPFRSVCDLGNPSQFTLRWYLKDGKCCSYPWGHCKGDDIVNEPAIRTKEECESLCLGINGGATGGSSGTSGGSTSVDLGSNGGSVSTQNGGAPGTQPVVPYVRRRSFIV